MPGLGQTTPGCSRRGSGGTEGLAKATPGSGAGVTQQAAGRPSHTHTHTLMPPHSGASAGNDCALCTSQLQQRKREGVGGKRVRAVPAAAPAHPPSQSPGPPGRRAGCSHPAWLPRGRQLTPALVLIWRGVSQHPQCQHRPALGTDGRTPAPLRRRGRLHPSVTHCDTSCP